MPTLTQHTDASRAGERPFLVEHGREGETAGGFVPSARLVVTPALRTSGLLAALPDAEARSLLCLLTFLTPNGDIAPTLTDLAAALRIPENQARSRMERLIAFLWEGTPLVYERQRELGRDVYSPSPAIVKHRLEAPQASSPPPSEAATGTNVATPVSDRREAVYAHSRAAYARPREEAERQVAEQLGHAVEEAADTPEGEARRKLIALGVRREQVEHLLTHHTAEECLRQVEWLPYRGAKSPARFVVAAIEGEYDTPLPVRLGRSLEEVGEVGESEGAPVMLPIPEQPQAPQEPQALQESQEQAVTDQNDDQPVNEDRDTKRDVEQDGNDVPAIDVLPISEAPDPEESDD